MNAQNDFAEEVRHNIASLAADTDLQALSRIWVREAGRHKWAYNFTWMGRPAIQFPNDAWALQEVVWAVQPDLIIETGVAHGGSIIYSASLLALLDYADAIESGTPINPSEPSRRVIGIDIDIRPHNRDAIEEHPMFHRIDLIEGSSIDSEVIARVESLGKGCERVLVCLDSNHTHDHVLAELEAYSPLVSLGSYIVVMDTLVEMMPADSFPDRPWGPGNSPWSAVQEFLSRHTEFESDDSIPEKLLISVAPGGFLRRVR